MAQYYINTAADPGGDGTTQALSGPNCAWNELSDITGLGAGDIVSLNKSNAWREFLVPAISGSAGNVITYNSYGSGDDPKILGSIAKNSTGDWTNESGSLWYAGSLSHEIKNLVYDSESSYATMVSLKASLNAQGKAWYDSGNNRVYVYSASNPATYYSGSIECCQKHTTWGYLVNFRDYEYLTFDGIDFRYGGACGIRGYGDGHITVQNCNFKFFGGNLSGWEGCAFYGANHDDFTFSGNTVAYVWAAVYHSKGSAGSCVATIQNNTISYNTMSTSFDYCIAFGGPGGGCHYEGSVISGNTISSFYGLGVSCSHGHGFTIESNIIHTNLDTSANQTNGILLTTSNSAGYGNTVRYNLIYHIYGNPASWVGGVGVSTRNDSDSDIYYNFIYECTKGIVVRETDGADYNQDHEIYNNTIVDCTQWGIRVHGGVSGTPQRIAIKNNILDGATKDLELTGDDDYITVTGGHNCFINDASVGLGTGSSYSGSGNDLYSTDPLFVDAANDDYKLTGSSPCKEAGTDVSLTRDYFGNTVPAGSAVDIGAHEYPAAGGGSNIYYLNKASSGTGDGTTTALSGPNAAWKDISEITGLAAGDYILFNRGNEWHEQLTIPVSGGAGDLISFGTYGAGAAPIINGADLITGWTEYPAYDVSNGDIFEDDFDDNDWTVDPTWDNVASAGGAVNQNEQLEVVVSAGGADHIYENTGAETELWVSYKVKAISYGDWQAGDWQYHLQLYDVATDRYGIRFGFDNDGGTKGWRCAWSDDAGAESRSDFLTPNTDTGTWFNILVHFKAATAPAANDGILEVWVDDVKKVDEDALDTDTIAPNRTYIGEVTGNGAPTLTFYMDDFAVGSDYVPGASNVWQAACTTEPEQVFFDETLGTKVGSIGACNGANEWYWTGNILYVYSASDPDTAYTSPGIEASNRDYCINGNAKNYIAVEGIVTQKAEIANILIDGIDCELGWITGKDGFALGVSITGNDNIIHDSTIKNNGGDGLSISGDNVDYYLNLIYGNGDGGVVVAGDSGEGYKNKVYDNTNIGLEISGASNKAYYSLIYGNGSDNAKVLTGVSNELYNLVSEGAGGHGFNIDESCTLRNCIERNSTGDSINIDGGKTVTGGYNCFEDAAKAGAGTYTDTDTSTLFSTDPLFTDIGGKDFTLQVVSPCIDTGMDVSLTEDFDGVAAPQGAGFDMGAFEFVAAEGDPGMGLGITESTPVVSRISEFELFDDWEKLVIFEHELARKLQEEVWIQCGSGISNAWYIDLPDDGEITAVEEDGEAYAEKFSIANCHATASTFYYDDLNKCLYIHTSGSDDPATLDGGDPLYNIVAFWWEYISSRPYQLEPYIDKLKEANGSLEFWASTSDAEDWTETTGVGSSISRESTNVWGGQSAYSAKLSSAGNQVEISRTDIVLRPGRKAKIRFKHKESASGKTIRVMLKDSGSNVYLNSDGHWETASTWIPITSATDWIEVDINFIAHGSYSSYYLYIANSDLTSASAYIDDVEVWRYRRMVDCNIFLPKGALPQISQSVGDYYQPDEQINYASVQINNASGYYWTRRGPQGYLWHNRDARIKAGKIDDDYDDLIFFFTGVTKNPSWGKIAHIDIEDERVLLQKIPIDRLDESTYPSCENEWRNKPKPILLGRVEDIKPPEIDTEFHKFKISQTWFGRIVETNYYLNDSCDSLTGWTEDNVGTGDVSQVTFDDKSTFKFYCTSDPGVERARIYRDVGTFPDSFTFELKWWFDAGLGWSSANKHMEVEIWNGSIKLHIRIDTDSIDIYNGAAWEVKAIDQVEDVWYIFKFVVDGSTPGSETVDIYRNAVLKFSNVDCSDADAVDDGKIQISTFGPDAFVTRHYSDYIRVWDETVIEVGVNHALQEIEDVYKTTSGGTKTTLTGGGVDYTEDLTNGEFTVSAAINDGDVITCDALGIQIDFEDGTYADLLGDFLYFLYVIMNDILKYRLDIASIIDIKTNRLLEVGIWLAEEMDSIDLLITMKKSGVFQTVPLLDGKIHFHRYSSDVPSDAPYYRVEDYATQPKFHEDTDQCFKTVVCKGHYLPYSGYYQYEHEEESEAAEWNHNEKDRLELDTILLNEFQLRDLAENFRSMLKNPIEIIEGVELPSSALLLNPCDKFYLTYVLKDDDNTEIEIYENEVFRVLTIEKDLNTGHAIVRAIKDVSDFFWTMTQ